MKDYGAMSDFEINCAVAIAIWDTDVTAVDLEFEPCSSWCDAGPIIVSNKISLHAPSLLDSWSAEFVGSDDDVNDGYEADYFQHRNINPLRAAMIIFLMMQERK